MAITRNQSSLVDSKLNNAVAGSQASGDQAPKDLPKIKKRSFLVTTIDELRQVQWPSVGYVLRWSLTIVIFTAVFALTLGFFDNGFEAGIKFADCTSPQGRAQEIRFCGEEALKIITLQN